MKKQIIAVCGKGGVGKTSISALIAKSIINNSVKPVLLIDGDPVMGLTFAVGERSIHTLSEIRDQIIASARSGNKDKTADMADKIDYLVFEALIERENYSLLAMGHSSEKGCFCPANTLLRDAIDLISTPFRAVLIDAEAGIEHISRDVTRSVNRIIVVVDGSRQSIETVKLIMNMNKSAEINIIANRVLAEKAVLPQGVLFLGAVAENSELSDFNRAGRSLWDLPESNEALISVRNIIQKLYFE